MTTHAAPPRSQSQPPLPNQPFFSWLRTNTTLFIGQIIGLLSVISVPIALVYYSHAIPAVIAWETVGDFIVYAHLLFLVVFIAVLIRGLDKNDTGSYRAKLVHEKLKGRKEDHERLEIFSTRQVGRFKRHFLRFWCSMLCLYFVFAIQPIFSVAANDCLNKLPLKEMFRTELFPILSFILNNISLIFIVCCFSVLHLPKHPSSDVSSSKRKWWQYSGLMRRLVKRLSDPELEEMKLRQRTLAWSVILGVGVLTLTFPLLMLFKTNVATNWSEYPAVFDALSGTINAVALALLVARLDSKLIGLPSWLICVLYAYAGVQPMFVVFELHPQVYAGIKTAVLLVVFIFKIYFFLIIFYTLQTGRMFNYFFCSEILNEHVKTLKEPAETAAKTAAETALKTQPVPIIEANSAEPAIELAEQSAHEVEPDIPIATVNEKRWSNLFQTLKAAIAGLLRPQGSTPTVPEKAPATGEEESEPAIVVFSRQPSEESRQSPPVKADKEDPRSVWLKRFGVVAILLFATSLLAYVSLSEEYKLRVDSFPLPISVVILHLILLLGILIAIRYLVVRDRRREKSGAVPSDEARFKAASELRFKLSEPLSKAEEARKYIELSDLIRSQFRDFTHYFRLFWILLLVLYVVMGLSLLGPQEPPTKSKDCAVVVGEKLVVGTKTDFSIPAHSAGSEHNQAESQPDHGNETAQIENAESSSNFQWTGPGLSIYEMPRKVKFSFLFFVVNNAMVLILFMCFTVLYIHVDDGEFKAKHRAKHRQLRNYGLLIGALLTLLLPLLVVIIKGNKFTQLEIEKIPTILGAVGGTLNAIAFALLIARLDSRIIGLRLLLVTVLYGYAALQPLFVTFNQPSNLLQFIATSAMIAAFIFKICLVFMVGHVRRSGGLIDYLWFFPVLNNSVNSIFGNQFEIKTYNPKPGSFTFTISNKNVETYRAAKMYESRTECDDAVKATVEAMKKRGNYSKPPKELQGTYWVQVKEDGHTFCESIGLRSQAEVDELINESMDKVPYCKYERG